MSPDQPSREEIEARLTALLLGELPEDEAKLLRWAIAHDAGLAKLYEQLKRTIGIVREVSVKPPESNSAQSAALKMSEERRRILLAYFKTPRPKPTTLFWLKRLEIPSLVPVLVALALIAVLAALMLPALSAAKMKARSTSQSNAIINNLRQLDAAKNEWALETGKPGDAVATMDDLKPYLKDGASQPIAGEKYEIGKVSELVTADIDAKQAKQIGSLASRLPSGGAGGEVVQLSSDGNVTVVSEAERQQHFAENQARFGFDLNTPAHSADQRAIALNTTLHALPGGGPVITAPVQASRVFASLPPVVSPPVVAQNRLRLGLDLQGGTSTKIVLPKTESTPEFAFEGEQIPLSQSTLSGYVAPQITESPAPAAPQVPAEPNAAILSRGIEWSGTLADLNAEFTLSQSPDSSGNKLVGDNGNIQNQVARVGGTGGSGDVTVNFATGSDNGGGSSRRGGGGGSFGGVAGGGGSVGGGNFSSPSYDAAVANGPQPNIAGSISGNGNLAAEVLAKRVDEFGTAEPVIGANPSDRQTQMRSTDIQFVAPGYFDGTAATAKNHSGDQARFYRSQTGGADAEKVSALGDMPVTGNLFAEGRRTVNSPAPTTVPAPSGALDQTFSDGYYPVGSSAETAKEVTTVSGGTLALNGENTFSGGTAVNAGKLAINNSVTTSSDRDQGVYVDQFQLKNADPGQAAQVLQNMFANSTQSSASSMGSASTYTGIIGSNVIVLNATNAFSVSGGNFSAGLTKDDVSGMRFLLATNNIQPKDTLAKNSAEGVGGLNYLNSGSSASTNTEAARAFVSSLGMNLQNPPGKSVAYNDRLGLLFVKGTEQDLDAIEHAISPSTASEKKKAANSNANDLSIRVFKFKPGANLPSATPITNDTPVPKPQQPAPIPQPEVQTFSNAFSTFSMNVSDVSFKLAEASLQKGRMPDAASIRSEEFINAFDYRDPEAKWDSASSLSAQTGKMPVPLPVAFASERARYPFAQNRDLLRFSIKTAAAGRAANRPLNLVLLLDTSGSMERADRVAIIREAMRVLSAQLHPQDTVSVVTFARTARLWADGVSGDKAGDTLDQVSGITPEGGTNLEEAMNLAYQTALRHYLANGANRVVLLTDGAANLGNVNSGALQQKVESFRKQGIALDCFGIGWDDYNDNLLSELSGNGDGRYAFINTPEEAGTDFAAKLAGALQVAAQDVKVQVEFNPQRVTSWRQIGYATHHLTKEQFRDNSVLAAEVAAQEAGNALYTVEIKPDGAGPVATVYVRYKVPGTMEVQEHSWTVSYDGNAPALEQSSPAMRLAGTASAFSEWLAGSPFAQEVTTDELLRDLSGVPQIYGADQRPGQLEWMIRQAKSLSGK